MATPLEALQNRQKLLAGNLGSSRTAYAPGVKPIFSDLSNDKQLSSVNKQIDDLRSQQIRNRWYGPSTDDKAEDPGGGDGFFMSGLKALQKPLNAIAGTAQYALGKGTQSSLTANINAATKSGLTFGNILQQEGAPRGVQIPLGFALDVMLDPANWLTMGSSTLIGGLGEGLARGAMKEGTESGIMGALKAAGTSVESNLARKASTLTNLMPNIVKNVAGKAPLVAEDGAKLAFSDTYRNIMRSGASKFTNLSEKIGAKAISSAEKYDALTGKTFESGLNKGFFGTFPSEVIGNKIENTIRSIPSKEIFGKMTPSGDKIVDFFKYSPKNASKISESYDAYKKLAENKNLILNDTEKGAHFLNIEDVFKPGATFSIPGAMKEGIDGALEQANQIMSVAEATDPIKIHDTLENAKSLINMALSDANLKNLAENIDIVSLEKAYKTTALGKTGFQWYDNVISSLKDLKIGDLIPGSTKTVEEIKNEAGDLIKTFNSYSGVQNLKPLEKLLNGYQQLLNIFKPAKVMMNPASHVVATIGNFTMGAMMGLPVWDPDYLSSMMTARKFVTGKIGAGGFKEMFFNDVSHLIDFADNSPTVFKDVSGIPANLIKNQLTAEEAVLQTFNSRTSGPAILKVLREGVDSVVEGLATGEKLSGLENVATKAEHFAAESKLNAKLLKDSMGKPLLPSESAASIIGKGSIKKSQEMTGITAGEYIPNQNMYFNKLQTKLAEMVKESPGRPDIQMANFIVNRMPAAYEHIDQSFKIGTLLHATNFGYTKAQLDLISRSVPFDIAKDLLKDFKTGEVLVPAIKNGQKYYRTTAGYASKVATETFMNYSAMPDFVKMMRAIPFGAPFVSFPYAMAIKTGKTVINNPAIFNKVGFMINEMNASRTPQEKDAMEAKYNLYLKSPAVVKIMGMWNTNVKNMVPFYQMQMLNPSERNYDKSSFQTQMMELSDQFPILNDPIGSVMKNYFLQPWVLSGSGEVAQGQFGEPLYPSYDESGKKIDSGLGTKAFYGGRAVAESLVPGVLSFAGLGNATGVLSPEAVNAVPSYGFRNLANAAAGIGDQSLGGMGRSSIGATTKEDAIRKTLRSLLGRSGLPAYTLDTTKTSK